MENAIESNNEKEVELINVITVEPEHQQSIIDNVKEIMEKLAIHKPGFISAKVYKSLDGTRIEYQIRWRSKKDGLAWFEVITSAKEVTKVQVKNADYRLYELVETIYDPPKIRV